MQSNIALAGMVGLLMNTSIQSIDSAVTTFENPPGRAQTIRIGSVTMIHDAYNANPTSTRKAFELFDITLPGRKVMVFGDMFEVGTQAVQAHQSVGIQADTNKIDLLITIGQCAKHAALNTESTTNHRFGQWSDDLPDQIAALLQPGDTVLLKASRGMRLERLIPAIEQRFGPPEEE